MHRLSIGERSILAVLMALASPAAAYCYTQTWSNASSTSCTERHQGVDAQRHP